MTENGKKRAGRLAREGADIQKFVQQYARKAHPGWDPNDRGYDRRLEAKIRRMDPEKLDALLRDAELE
ncbi:hypothetical protein [Bosea beijingensis]|uniref:hypothetical protein n=1 Tax=Bosea beijingensis TaxID=3068632 RepID=UPI0027414305|nr:hypothetical protein [Bosea sp. REN20]